MKKNIILIFCLTLFLFATQLMCVAETRAEKLLNKHPEFVSIGNKWVDKLGNHYLVNLTENRVLEFDQINSLNGGGKYACLMRIGEFELIGSVKYPKDSSTEAHWKDRYSSYARFQDLSQGMGVKIETMIDVINHYDEILNFVKMIAKEQFFSENYVYHIDSENRKATIWVWTIHGFFFEHWHGAKEEDLKNHLYETLYGDKNWSEKLNADLPKIRKSLGLE